MNTKIFSILFLSIFFFSTSFSITPEIHPDLEYYYAMNDNGENTTIADYFSVFNNGESVKNTTDMSSELLGGEASLYFDGVEDFIKFDEHPLGDFNAVGGDEFSLSFWVMLSSYNKTMILMGRQESNDAYGWRLQVENDNTLSMIFSNSTMTQTYNSDFVIPYDTGVFIAYSHNSVLGNRGNFYFDGELDTHNQFSWELQGETNEDEAGFQIGYTSNESDTYFNGQMDDVRVYNDSLSSAEILSMYNDYMDIVEAVPESNATSTAINGLIGFAVQVVSYGFELTSTILGVLVNNYSYTLSGIVVLGAILVGVSSVNSKAKVF